MSVLKSKRSTSKAEYVNLANEIYTETVAFLTRLSARYARLLAEPVAALAGEVIDQTEKANRRRRPPRNWMICRKAWAKRSTGKMN